MCKKYGWAAGRGVPLGVYLTDKSVFLVSLLPMIVVTPSMMMLTYFLSSKI